MMSLYINILFLSLTSGPVWEGFLYLLHIVLWFLLSSACVCVCERETDRETDRDRDRDRQRQTPPDHSPEMI